MSLGTARRRLRLESKVGQRSDQLPTDIPYALEHDLYEDGWAEGNAGGETEGKSNINLRAQADYDTDAVFANTREDSL